MSTMKETRKGIDFYRYYINGEWMESKAGDIIEVENPANGEVFASISFSSKEDAQYALESSEIAQKKWQALPPIERAKYIMAIVDRLKDERDLFAKLLVTEQGKTLAEAYGEVDDTMRYMSYSAEAARRIQGSIFPSDLPNEQLSIHKVPYGVTVGLCAFNYPLALIGRKVGPALITGNTMVIKPHELTPVTASEFCRLVDEAGLPTGVINMAVEAAVVARYANCGQVCICNEMVLVHEKIADEFTEKLLKRVSQIKVGDPMQNVDMGPGVSTPGLERVDRIVRENVAQGAELAMGGKRPEGKLFDKGNWYEPTVLLNVKHDHASVENEIFGPVLPIVKVSGYEEALDMTNVRKEGLSAYLFTKDYTRIMHAIQNMQVGTIFVNKGIVGYIQGYHSGHKLSGLGGEDGIYGIECYLQKRTIYLSYEA